MSEATDLKERLARLSPKQRALLDQRLAAGRDAAAASEYLAMVPAVPLRTEAFGRPNEPTGQVTVYPASHSQQRMWFLHEYSERLPVYVIPSSFHLIGPLDEELLLGAVSDVVRRHDTLRTTFVMAGEQLLQYVASGAEFAFEAENFQAVPETERSAAANRYLEEVASRTFDLAAAPGFRVALARLGPEEHVLCFVLHHIISDGWSRSNLWREVGACYAARATGIGMPLPPLPVQVVDYAAWQQRQLSAGVFEKQAEYWEAQLAGDLEPLELPSDRPRPSKESFRGAIAIMELDAQLISNLTARAREEGATLFMILLAAFKVLLHRYTGREDLLVGVPIANRQRVEVEDLVGFFVNTLVMRTRLADQPTFREVLVRVKEAAVQAYAHQDMPFERLVEMLQLRRDAGAAKPFDVTFALQDFPAVSLELPGILTAPWKTETHTAKFDFSLAVEKISAGWMATAEYNTDLFDADRVVRMLGHWQVLLESIANDPGQRLAEIPMLSAQERHRILIEWNDTERDYPRDKCIHQLFEEQVDRTPDEVALVFDGQSLTYRELNARAICLADHLISLGVGPEVIVGLCIERSLEMVVGMLGILKAGGAYLPLDPEYPSDRLAFMINDSAVPVIVTREFIRPMLPITKASIVSMDVDWPKIETGSPDHVEEEVRPANLAYMIYTSGSTGRPKGVMVPHRAIVNHMCWMREVFPMDAGDLVLQKTPFSFDASVWEFYAPLLAGGRLVMASPGGHSDPDYLVKTILTEGITHFQAVPSLLRVLTKIHGFKDCQSLRRVFSGGEALTAELAGDIRRLSGAELHNLYGPTETTIDSTHYPVKDDEFEGRAVSIGRPVANLRAYILDQRLEPVPVGVAGELFIGGAGLARGYHNLPGLTEERFFSDPFCPKLGERIYKTGDRARYLTDGNIEYLGRFDNQVKIRGHRIELGEVEAVVRGHPQVRESAVLAIKDVSGDQSLAAFVVADGESDPTVEGLRQFLKERLPEPMIPSRFVVVPALPLTPNGKLDRKALETLEGDHLSMEAKYVAPRSGLEQALAAIWQDLLRRDRVGMTDNFFHVGGHSLVAITLCAEIARRMAVEVPLRRVFEHPTIEEMARWLEGKPENSRKVAPMPLADRTQPLSVSFAQQGMWLLQHILPDPAAYNVPKAFRFSGRVDREHVRASLRVISERHEVLRTGLVIQGEDLVQQVADAKDFPLPWREVDLRSAPIPEQASALRQVLEEEARRAFDLAEPPLWRVVWIQLAEDDQVLALTFHHSIMDEWSMRLLFQELSRLYDAGGNKELAGLPELPVQYADFAASQRENLTGELLEQQRVYWAGQLQGLPQALELPIDSLRPARPSGRGAVHDFGLTESIVARLRDLAREEGTTLFAVLLAAFQVWLHRYTGATDLVVGTPVANRKRIEIESLLGFFLNTLPIRLQLEGQPSFRNVLRQVRGTLLEAFSHSELPFEQIVEIVAKERCSAHQPIYQVMFVLLQDEFPKIHLDGIEASFLQVETGTSKNDLRLSIEASGETWSLRMEYSTDLLGAETVGRMAGHLTALLESITSEPETPIGNLRLMSPEEDHQLLVDWNDTARDYPRDKCIHHLFEEQVQESPETIAVIFGQQSLSYRELNARANQVASYLLSLGVKPDGLVGLCVERSLEMVVALLGILKAGAAYVPMDPDYPRDRLTYMIEDSGCSWLVTQAGVACVLPESMSNVICLEDLPGGLPMDDLDAFATPNNLAYVLYTSGSTGQPKGVAMEHGALVNLMFWGLNQSNGRLRTLQFASLNFDVSFQEIFSTWLSGGTLFLVDFETRMNPTALWELIALRNLERLFLPVVMLQHLVEASKCSPLPSTSLREIITAGEQLRITPAIREFFMARPTLSLHNHYGPTESHVVTAWTMPSSPANWPELPPIGKPIANTRIYLLDKYRNPVPAGVPGELHIGGVALARCYLHKSEQTAQRFFQDPFVNDPGARIYSTGDLARYRTDGSIEYLGRTDHQVKIRGFRVELGEIETWIAGHPDLKACAVVAQPAGIGGNHLKAFLVGRSEEALSLESIRVWAGNRLPDYMVPAHFYTLTSLPLTPNGKVDRKALETLEAAELASDTAYVAPRSELQSTLVEVWGAVLGRDQVGVHDNFFELGGHSLLAVAICSKVKNLLHLEIPLRWIFDHPTIESLSTQIERQLSGGVSESSEPIRKADRRGPFPMSFAQQGMWLLQQMLPDPAAYNVPKAFRFSGRVDREHVRASLRVISERHEVLRTGLVMQWEDLVQQVADAKDFPLPWREVDLRSTAIPERASVWQQVLEEEARRAFDLAEAPLWRILWIQLAEDDQVLAFTFHHSIMDESSVRLLFQELSCLYHAGGNEELAGLPELPMQYADFAIWQRERLRGKEMEAQRNFWSEQLRDLPPDLDLRCGIPKPLHRSGRGAIQSFRLAGEVAARLNVLSREENATSFMTALAAYQVWLYRFTGQDDLVVATPITGRERREFQNLIGFFLNTLPIRCRMKGHQGFEEILRQVRQTVLDAFDHARLPFEEMVELAVKEREAHSQPLHQVMFVFVEQVLPQLILDQAKGHLVPMHNHTSKCDLIFSVKASERGWDCQLEYACDIFTEEEAGRMAGHLKELLEAIAEAPRKPIDQLRLMPDSERHRLLVEWNQTGRNYPRDKCAHQIFEEQVNRAPEAVALQSGDVCLSYQEVNVRANRLAHHLRSLGVAPDVLVGLCTERSVEMIIALLGILKAGGAYVPLDPKLPIERLRVLLHETNASLVLCQRLWRDRMVSLAGESSQGGQVLGLEDLLESLEGSDSSDLPCTNKPGDLAYVMFTSGTTGKPKGVMVPHRGIVRLVVDPDYVELGPADVLLQFAPISFDASTFEIWGSLLNGAKLVLPPSESFDLAELGSAITGHGVTTLWLTAALFHQMVELQPAALAGVRQLLAGGDVLSPARVRDYLEMPGHGRLINGYGPTENTTFTCCGVFDEASQVGASVPIGRPIAGTTVYILDKQGEPVPPGVAGELHAGGDGLARGYLNAPELTQGKFVADPFSMDPEARLYKTGDLARWRPDGTIEFLGRFDHQVKIRGYRIELGEIEHALRGCPGVSDAVVVVSEAESGDKQLFAYLVDTASPQADPASVRARLCSTLPEYMLPNAFVWLDQLPLTPNGKVERNKLPAPDQSYPKDAQPSDQASSLLELELIRIWERFFHRSGIGRNDNFFDLGGHSLQAARLAAEVEKLLDRKVPIATLFQSPTIASFARRLTDDNWAPAWSSLVPLQPSGSKPPLFLIHGWGGDVYGFLDLARAMKNDRPIYGVQAVGLDGLAPRHTSVEEMARHYAREIRSLQPEGPYHLAGFSLGGWIAYAVAQELSSEGGTVAFLGLLDTHATSHVPMKAYLGTLLPHFRKRLGVHLRQWRELPLAERGRYFLGRWNALSYLILRKRSRTQLPTESSRDIQMEDQPDYYYVASALYRPKVYSGHVDFFAAETSTPSLHAFWKRMAHGGVSIHHVSGTHGTMLATANIESLAKSMEAALSKAG